MAKTLRNDRDLTSKSKRDRAARIAERKRRARLARDHRRAAMDVRTRHEGGRAA